MTMNDVIAIIWCYVCEFVAFVANYVTLVD